jgi:hypothetical protein
MGDLELKKRYAALYKSGAKSPALVEVPPLRFLMIDGEGPYGADSERFRVSVQALLTLAYRVKFAAKKEGLTYQVMPLEGLYREAGSAAVDTPVFPSGVDWRLMVLLPDEVDGELVDEARERAFAKKRLARLEDVRVQTFSEGMSVQVLHVGPYADEPATVGRLLAFASERGLALTGPHHEIYLSDPARTASDKLKTLLRYGVRKG